MQLSELTGWILLIPISPKLRIHGQVKTSISIILIIALNNKRLWRHDWVTVPFILGFIISKIRAPTLTCSRTIDIPPDCLSQVKVF